MERGYQTEIRDRDIQRSETEVSSSLASHYDPIATLLLGARRSIEHRRLTFLPSQTNLTNDNPRGIALDRYTKDKGKPHQRLGREQMGLLECLLLSGASVTRQGELTSP